MFFIDIAVPRDVDPELNKLDGIFVYDIDDLQQAVASHVADRRKEAEKPKQSSMAKSKSSGPPADPRCRSDDRLSARSPRDYPAGRD